MTLTKFIFITLLVLGFSSPCYAQSQTGSSTTAGSWGMGGSRWLNQSQGVTPSQIRTYQQTQSALMSGNPYPVGTWSSDWRPKMPKVVGTNTSTGHRSANPNNFSLGMSTNTPKISQPLINRVAPNITPPTGNWKIPDGTFIPPADGSTYTSLEDRLNQAKGLAKQAASQWAQNQGLDLSGLNGP